MADYSEYYRDIESQDEQEQRAAQFLIRGLRQLTIDPQAEALPDLYTTIMRQAEAVPAPRRGALRRMRDGLVRTLQLLTVGVWSREEAQAPGGWMDQALLTSQAAPRRQSREPTQRRPHVERSRDTSPLPAQREDGQAVPTRRGGLSPEAVDQLRLSFRILQHDEQELLALRYIDGLSLAELAQRSHVPEHMLGERLQTALDHLRAIHHPPR